MGCTTLRMCCITLHMGCITLHMGWAGIVVKQVGADPCQAQFKLGLAKTISASYQTISVTFPVVLSSGPTAKTFGSHRENNLWRVWASVIIKWNKQARSSGFGPVSAGWGWLAPAQMLWSNRDMIEVVNIFSFSTGWLQGCRKYFSISRLKFDFGHF